MTGKPSQKSLQQEVLILRFVVVQEVVAIIPKRESKSVKVQDSEEQGVEIF